PSVTITFRISTAASPLGSPAAPALFGGRRKSVGAELPESLEKKLNRTPDTTMRTHTSRTLITAKRGQRPAHGPSGPDAAGRSGVSAASTGVWEGSSDDNDLHSTPYFKSHAKAQRGKERREPGCWGVMVLRCFLIPPPFA